MGVIPSVVQHSDGVVQHRANTRGYMLGICVATVARETDPVHGCHPNPRFAFLGQVILASLARVTAHPWVGLTELRLGFAGFRLGSWRTHAQPWVNVTQQAWCQCM